MYDLLQHTYIDTIVQKRRYWDEVGALVDMVDRSDLDKVLLLADRGYESYNALAHIQEKGWHFLIRIKNSSTGITSGLTLPDEDDYDISFHLNLTRKQTNSVKNCWKTETDIVLLQRPHALIIFRRSLESRILQYFMVYRSGSFVFLFLIPHTKQL